MEVSKGVDEVVIDGRYFTHGLRCAARTRSSSSSRRGVGKCDVAVVTATVIAALFSWISRAVLATIARVVLTRRDIIRTPAALPLHNGERV